jgi:uncharacterized protein YdhG (YjbR/CyaY superfamily)
MRRRIAENAATRSGLRELKSRRHRHLSTSLLCSKAGRHIVDSIAIYPSERLKGDTESVSLGGKAERGLDSAAVSAEEVDAYLAEVDEPKRSTLQALRRTILEIVPDAEQVISYRVPAFRVQGKIVAGFAAFRNHLSYLPFSGSVLPQLADELDGYTMTKSALHFPVSEPLPKALVQKLIAARLEEASGRSH